MIIGIIHKGSGLGDQLFSYIATRVRAADLGVDYAFIGKEFFKGTSFMNLDWGNQTQQIEYSLDTITGEVRPLMTREPYNGIYKLDKPSYDPEFNFIKDWTYIDGYGAQDERYFKNALLWDWLPTEMPDIDPLLCVINMRGGEYRGVPELFLPKSYFDEAIEQMKTFNPKIQFEVHTDDLELAQQWFPEYKAVKNIEQNWLALRYANFAIISNSAFGIIPRWMCVLGHTIAPRFWAGRNVGEWRRPGNYYSKFLYI